ncbi:hypothetical protein PoB_001995800 [Plakobranchus ocellatus]|uniref:Uncharacterized protein n=1 Tax=Plakobranchus ocellatus TaxID=259542 RepID=A0AAV3ZFB7_9GAST|nr:hypothetical protein PoB_001995800 [Plakobranchus ocellatus]
MFCNFQLVKSSFSRVLITDDSPTQISIRSHDVGDGEEKARAESIEIAKRGKCLRLVFVHADDPLQSDLRLSGPPSAMAPVVGLGPMMKGSLQIPERICYPLGTNNTPLQI